jgi:hypothetical protein
MGDLTFQNSKIQDLKRFCSPWGMPHGFIVPLKKFPELKKLYIFASSLSRGVIGNTSDSGSEESRFEP